MKNAAFRTLFISLSLALLSAPAAFADRIVLAPAGATLNPNSLKAEGLYSPYGADQNRAWLQYSSPYQIELEYNRTSLRNDKIRHSFNVEYPYLTDLGTVPAISFGIRDLFGTGLEHEAVYFAIGKTIGLSERQEKLIRELHLNFGAGTGTIRGAFVGVQIRFRGSLSLDAEWYRNRPNVSLGLNLTRNLQIKASSLDGTVYYGLAFSLIK